MFIIYEKLICGQGILRFGVLCLAFLSFFTTVSDDKNNGDDNDENAGSYDDEEPEWANYGKTGELA